MVMEILDHLDGARLARGETAGTFGVGIEQDAEGLDDDFVMRDDTAKRTSDSPPSVKRDSMRSA